MNVLLVLAHPEPTSFCAALRDAAREELGPAGHATRDSDLYAMRWDPVLGPAAFPDHPPHERFAPQAAQRHAVARGTQSADVLAEQAKLAWSDAVVVIFPVWWFGVPAILKGWFDRVLALDVAYGGGRWFDDGVYRGRRVLIACTTGARADRFSEHGLFGPLDLVLHPLRVGTFNFCGFDTLEPFVAWAAPHVDDGARADCLSRWRGRIRALGTETPQPFRRLADHADPGMRDHR